MRRALYAGSFDPPTLGHVDIARRAVALFDEVVVAVARNAGKLPIFSVAERIELLRGELSAMTGVRVVICDGLAVDCARKEGCSVLVRGIRTAGDLESELAMALTNHRMADDLETVFLPPSERFTFLSSRLVKEVVVGGGSADGFLSPAVEERLRQRLVRP